MNKDLGVPLDHFKLKYLLLDQIVLEWDRMKYQLKIKAKMIIKVKMEIHTLLIKEVVFTHNKSINKTNHNQVYLEIVHFNSEETQQWVIETINVTYKPIKEIEQVWD